jgi:hypothetical protein
MMARARLPWAVAVLAAVVTSGGCGGDGKVSVNGVVMLDNQPVEGAIVTFIPLDDTKGKIAHGTTDKAGAFQLTTTTPNDGCFPGEYKVTVLYAEGAEPPAAKGMKEAFTGFEKAQGQKLKPPKYKIPPGYDDAEKTILRQKVPPDGKVILALTSK